MSMDIRKLRVKNTKQEGLLEFLVYRDGNKYTGVCLTLDIIEEGSNSSELMKSIQDAAIGHVKLVIKKHLNDDLLNRLAPDEYWEKYFNVLDALSEQTRKLRKNQSLVSQLPIEKGSLVKVAA